MKATTVLCAAAVAELVAAGPVAATKKLSQETMVEELLKVPFMMPQRTYDILKMKYGPDSKLQKRQDLTSLSGIMDALGKLGPFLPQLPDMFRTGSTSPGKNPPKSNIPVLQYSEPTVFTGVGAKKVKVRYGPYRIPPTSEKNLESEFWKISGMSNNFEFNGKRPCEECTLLSATADLEYGDGTMANNSNGAWFHHGIIFNAGMNIVEPTCNQALLESIFLVGNERTDGGYALKGADVKSGYRLHPGESFIMQMELMNLHDKEKWVWPAVTFEYIEGKAPEYKNGKTIWMTIGQTANPGFTFCDRQKPNPFGASNLTADALPKSMKFSEHSKKWQSGVEGYILKAAGHLHEGATGIDIFQNDKRICESLPKYSKDAPSSMPGEKKEEGKGHSHGMRKRQIRAGNYTNDQIEHISGQTNCEYSKGIKLAKGDTMHVVANYDFDVRAGMKNTDGVLDQVMGIVGVLVAY